MNTKQLAEVSRLRALAASGKARELREQADVTLREAAAVLGTCPSTLSRCETGACRPKPALALRWALLLSKLSGESV